MLDVLLPYPLVWGRLYQSMFVDPPQIPPSSLSFSSFGSETWPDIESSCFAAQSNLSVPSLLHSNWLEYLC